MCQSSAGSSSLRSPTRSQGRGGGQYSEILGRARQLRGPVKLAPPYGNCGAVISIEWASDMISAIGKAGQQAAEKSFNPVRCALSP
jgi:hypothetical protein